MMACGRLRGRRGRGGARPSAKEYFLLQLMRAGRAIRAYKSN
jgi:hypothetical protein